MGAMKQHFHDEICTGQALHDDEFLLHDQMEEAAQDLRDAEVRRAFRACGSVQELNELAKTVLDKMAQAQRRLA